MGIKIDGKEIIGVTVYGKIIATIYAGGKLVWEAIKCCFSRGWDNDKGWNNDEGWNND